MFKAASHRQQWQLWVYTISANQTLEHQCRQLENKDHTITCVYMVRCSSVRDIWARNELFGYKKQHSCANTTFWLTCLALRSKIFRTCCSILLLSSQDFLTPSHGLLPHSLHIWCLLQQMILEGLWRWQGGLFVTAKSQSVPWDPYFPYPEWSSAQWKKIVCNYVTISKSLGTRKTN